MTTIVYGPPACGKTRNALKLARKFGCTEIVDDWDPRQHELTYGALHLTNAPGLDATVIHPAAFGYRTYAFASINLDNIPEGNASRVAPRFINKFNSRRRT